MESIANFIGREGFNWWIGQVENDGAKFWNAELDDGAGDFDYGDWDWTNKVKVRIMDIIIQTEKSYLQKIYHGHRY